jgi:CheY-like chemotaxis protein
MKRKKNLSILVVENHQDTLEAMKMFLGVNGHSVETAATMRAALDATAQDSFDLIITDIGLPDGDGWELMRSLRQNGPVRAVAMSGYGCKEDIEKSHAVGFQAHLLKPLKVSDLEAVVRKVERQVAAEAATMRTTARARPRVKADLLAR